MSYKDSSPKLAAKYTSSIDTETIVITNGAPKFKVDYDIIGTTDATSDAWQLYTYNKTKQKLFSTIKYPVYHTITKEHHDMGYNSKGRRCPVIDNIDLYVWSVSEGKPIIYKYDINMRNNTYYLRKTIKDRTEICSLSIKDGYYDQEEDDIFTNIYQRISDILFSQCK